jgi:predicted outer membrane protein
MTMPLTSRRNALLALAAVGAAAPALLSVQRASAQTSPTPGGNQTDYVVQTLTVGTLALRTSEVAAEKATDPMVKEFANLEIGEQQAIASVLSATEAGKTPPELPPEQAAKVEELSGMEAGPEFDAAYIQGQIDGHNQLLEIQKTLSGETVATLEAITAKLAEQAVTSHLAMLNHIQSELGQSEAGAEPPAEAGEGNSPDQPAEAEAQPPEGAAPEGATQDGETQQQRSGG